MQSHKKEELGKNIELYWIKLFLHLLMCVIWMKASNLFKLSRRGKKREKY